MTAEEIIEQLERLIDDREAFIRAYAPDRTSLYGIRKRWKRL